MESYIMDLLPAGERTYQDAIQSLTMLRRDGWELQKARRADSAKWQEMIAFLSAVDVSLDDIDALKPVHVTGTKGKGSTGAYTERLLRFHGLRTGFFTSPSLVTMRERVRIDGRPLSEQDFNAYFWHVHDRLMLHVGGEAERMPGRFTTLVVFGMFAFKRKMVDVAVIEVGIGGEFDCTNIIRHPSVCAVTTVGVDHWHMLGRTRALVAHQKAGIFKEGSVAVVADQADESAMQALVDRASERHVQIYTCPPLSDYPVDARPWHLAAAAQWQNVTHALQLVRVWMDRREDAKAWTESATAQSSAINQVPPRLPPFPVSSQLQTILTSLKWPARFDVRQVGASLTFYVDGAHTPESCDVCWQWFDKQRDHTIPCALVFHAIEWKEYAYFLEKFHRSAAFRHVIFSPKEAHRPAEVGDAGDVAYNALKMEQYELSVKLGVIYEAFWKSLDADDGGNAAVALLHQVGCADDAFKLCVELANNGEALQVLCTGSMALAGSMLSVIDPCIDQWLTY